MIFIENLLKNYNYFYFKNKIIRLFSNKLIMIFYRSLANLNKEVQANILLNNVNKSL